MPVMVAPEIAEQQQEREYAIFVAKREAQQLEKKLLVSPEHKTVNSAFRNLCYILHRLACKYVPNSAITFADYSEFLHCTRMLQEMGFKPEIDPAADAAVNGLSVGIIRSSFEYRQLRNKIKASLSVIADLTERPASPGSPDYQKGVREGYRRASEIAIMFLDDID